MQLVDYIYGMALGVGWAFVRPCSNMLHATSYFFEGTGVAKAPTDYNILGKNKDVQETIAKKWVTKKTKNKQRETTTRRGKKLQSFKTTCHNRD
jgi:hypothetical protein